MLNRRGFLRAMVGGIAVAAAERTFPFRVFSFPKEIVVPPGFIGLQLEQIAHMLPELMAGDAMLLQKMGGLRYFDVMPSHIGPYLGLRRTLALPQNS